jgi:hypothetical protein
MEAHHHLAVHLGGLGDYGGCFHPLYINSHTAILARVGETNSHNPPNPLRIRSPANDHYSLLSR